MFPLLSKKAKNIHFCVNRSAGQLLMSLIPARAYALMVALF